MALQKQTVNINFAQGLDTKTDPKQVAPGKFLSLQNTIFTKAGLLQKRNGFIQLPTLPDTSSTFATTFNGNLTAIGTSLNAYGDGSQTWVNKGAIQPINLSVLPLVRSNFTQTQADSAVAPNGLICTVYTETGSGSTTYNYVIADSKTGQNVVPATSISTHISGAPRIFLLGNYFIIVFSSVISAANHLQYIAINTFSLVVTAPTDISTSFTPATTLAFDGYVANNNLYVAWNGSDGGGAIRVSYIDSHLTQHSTVVFAGKSATFFSVTADITGSTPDIYISFYNTSTPVGYVIVLSQSLVTITGATSFTTTAGIVNLASVAQKGGVTIFQEVGDTYSYSSSIAGDSNDSTNFIQSTTIARDGTLLVANHVVARSLGLASKAFIISGSIYFMGVYYSLFQPTYFLMNAAGQVVSRLAYSNGGGYYVTGIPEVTVNGTTAQVTYLFKDSVQAANKATVSNNPAGVYSQIGVNLVTFNFNSALLASAEIGNNLNLTGGFLLAYDGYIPSEQNFFLWPDHIGVSTATGSGSIAAGTYTYQITYEWADSQGNLFRSAPSIPVSQVTTTSSSTNTIKVPTLRLTYKINASNPVKIVVYRASVSQPIFYQVTSITAPVLNNVTIDSVTITDTLADSSIIGNNILYTTGGVIENIGPPSFNALALYKSRLFGIDAEDPNLLWFSKQVIEATPVEMSDLFTIYIAPTQSAQGTTGPMRALSALDDKLIIFKKDAIYYITGNGPDNTGANNDFSDPVFITSTVGSVNPKSIVFIPNGLMFQSDKGIWLLGRDLSTTYLGAPVEAFNQYEVLSSLNIPATNQVRFTLSNGITLMYDYFFNQWGSFIGIPNLSSTLFQGKHTFINSYGAVYQESDNYYLDGSNPVLMSFTTGWMNLTGLQGFERIYFFYLLGQFITPHKLAVQVAYDYNSSPSQQSLISPENYSSPWGGDAIYGDASTWGGALSLEQWRVFTQKQKCQAFQITVNEIYDASFGVPAGAGLTLSGIDMVVGMKGSYPRIKAATTIG